MVNFLSFKSKFISAPILIFITCSQLFGQNYTRHVDDFLRKLSGKMTPSVKWYSGTQCDSTKSFISGSMKINNSEWACQIVPNSSPEKGALDLTTTFQLVNGKATSATVAVSFDFDEWNDENYLMVPAIVYNGNRFHTVGNGYMPTYTKDMFYNKDLPITMSNNPRLSYEKDKISVIELLTGNAATPAICFYSPSAQLGFILLTNQSTQFGNNGMFIEENANHNHIRFDVSVPGVRKMAAGFGDFFPSGDHATDWNAGDQVTLNFRLFVFPAKDIPALFSKFMQVRKSLSGPNRPRNLMPMSEEFRLASSICKNNWITVQTGSFYMPENSKNFQLGWVSGMMNTFPMLALNDEKERERVFTEFDFVIDRLQGKSGYFYGGITSDGKINTDKPNPEIKTVNALIRKNNDALVWFYKHFMLLKEQGYGGLIRQKWELAAKRLAMAYCDTWDKFGQLGQYIDPETGEIVIFNSTASAAAPAGLALASIYCNEPSFLKHAIAIVNYYYRQHVVKLGYSGGYSGDTSQDPDADSAYGLLESIMAIYYATGDPKWLPMAKTLANMGATFTLSYDAIFPPGSAIAKLDGHMAGAVWASVQNKHAAPGICTASGDYIFKLYRATGNRLYADLIRDIQHAHTEAVDMPGHRTTNYGFGTSMERIQPTDGEGKGSIGNFVHTRNSWTETNGMLMDLELPGIYLQTDKDEMYVFDHVEARVVTRSGDKTILSVSNKTPFDAHVSVFAESSEQAAKPLSYTAFVHWPKVDLKSGETKNITISKNGRIIPD